MIAYCCDIILLFWSVESSQFEFSSTFNSTELFATNSTFCVTMHTKVMQPRVELLSISLFICIDVLSSYGMTHTKSVFGKKFWPSISQSREMPYWNLKGHLNNWRANIILISAEFYLDQYQNQEVVFQSVQFIVISIESKQSRCPFQNETHGISYMVSHIR